MIGAALCTSYGWILLRVLVKDSEVSPMMANGMSMFVGGLMALVHSFFIDSWNPLPVASSNMGSFIQGILIITLISPPSAAGCAALAIPSDGAAPAADVGTGLGSCAREQEA